ncbi:hypothetical protein VCHENC02_0948B, partial [Vibrio harveyi]
KTNQVFLLKNTYSILPITLILVQRISIY